MHKIARRCVPLVIVGTLAIVVTPAAARDIDPPLTERTLGALRKACLTSGLGYLTHHLVLRNTDRFSHAGSAFSRPAALTVLSRMSPRFFCPEVRREGDQSAQVRKALIDA